MLDINFIRENQDKVKENLKRKDRVNKIGLIDSLIKEDKKLRRINLFR